MGRLRSGVETRTTVQLLAPKRIDLSLGDTFETFAACFPGLTGVSTRKDFAAVSTGKQCLAHRLKDKRADVFAREPGIVRFPSTAFLMKRKHSFDGPDEQPVPG